MKIAHLFAIGIMIPFAAASGEQVPLTYAFSPKTGSKYPIQLSFNQSITSTPFVTTELNLYNLNISMETEYLINSSAVIIGLKQPSIFLSAIRATFQVEAKQIEFGKKQYTSLLIKDNNIVESSDSFQNENRFTIKVKYNYGPDLYKDNEICSLIDGDEIYFDQLFILEVLNSMNEHNGITFIQDSSKNQISISGDLDNFPKISLLQGKSIFEVSINKKIIFYIPRYDNQTAINLIGYNSLYKFSKFAVGEDNQIVFKRTSQFYQLYLFLAYFFLFTLSFLIFYRSYLRDSMQFVKNVVAWIVFQDPHARVSVLQTQLQ